MSLCGSRAWKRKVPFLPIRDASGGMRAVLPLVLALAAAGCFAPGQESVPTTTTPVPATPTAPADASCVRFDVAADPESAPAGQPQQLVAELTNCGDATLPLLHACLRGMDVRILVLANSTAPETPAPPGTGPLDAYLVDNPIANRPLACATAPPHVRDVAPGETRTYAVPWSGLYAPDACAEPACVRYLEPGRYLLAANAENADTREAYIATAWLTVT